MSLDPTVLHAMKNAGASVEVILAAIDAQAKVDEQRRERLRGGNAERQRRHRSHAPSQRDKCDPPNEYISNPPVSSALAKANTGAPAFCETIVEYWNRYSPCGFRKAQALRGKRVGKLKSRLKEFGEEGLLRGIRCLSTSEWHTGKRGDWRATLGWYLTSDENVNKALEFDDPGERGNVEPIDRAASLEKHAAIYRKMGRDDEAVEYERQAKALRDAA